MAWALVALPVAVAVFLGGSRTTVIAGHDAVVSPTLDGYAQLDLGPFIPAFRVPTGSPLGATIDLGATSLDSYEDLVDRYAFIASQPEGQIGKVRDTLTALALDSAALGAVVGLAGPALLLVVGRQRRHELLGVVTVRRSVAVVAGLAVLTTVLVVLRHGEDEPVAADTWEPLESAFPDLVIPAEAAQLEIRSGLLTTGTRRLVESALSTYRTSLDFYSDLVAAAPALSTELRQPAEDETVALLVSDRHDNVGMDPVARAIGEAGGATFLLDAGDDTSTGGSWEAFSLDSLHEAFADWDDRFAVAGNHDNGDFVSDYLDGLGFTVLRGDIVEGPDGIRLLGAADPRSSGLGSWRDEGGAVTFDEQRQLIADAACESDEAGERITTLLVHDANVGDTALERGCVDLVVGGHLHVQEGPDPVVGENGRTGFAYTNGTTGGAAYAIAIGSKPRRDAMVSLVTYREGRPVGVQAVEIRTNGSYRVQEYAPLVYGETFSTAAPAAPGDGAPRPAAAS